MHADIFSTATRVPANSTCGAWWIIDLYVPWFLPLAPSWKALRTFFCKIHPASNKLYLFVFEVFCWLFFTFCDMCTVFNLCGRITSVEWNTNWHAGKSGTCIRKVNNLPFWRLSIDAFSYTYNITWCSVWIITWEVLKSERKTKISEHCRNDLWKY